MRVMVTHLSGERRGHRELFAGPVVTIGRARGATVRLGRGDTRASALHAELRVEGDRFVLVDVGSTNGTFVGGRRIERHRVRNADVVAFGFGGPELLLEFFDELPQERPSTAETHEFPIKFAYKWRLWAAAAGLAMLAVVALAIDSVVLAIPAALASAALFFVGLAFARVNVTVGPAGLEHEGLTRTRRLAWADVATIETSSRRVGLLHGAVCVIRGRDIEIRFAPSDYVGGHVLARLIAEATGKEWL